MSLKDKVIVLTGAASGIGLETSRLLASKGAKLSLADVQEKPLKELEAELQQSGVQVISFVVDVSKRDQVEHWIAATVEKFGKLDGAANLAGVIGRQNNIAGIEDIDDEDWNFIFGVNTYGLMNCMRAQIPHFNDGGAIVNAASILGLKGAKKSAAYVASKHAVVGLTRSAAKELGDRNIRVNCFCP
jgi:NAD(P)-dependent dehydrogenase (short-subunit alcohol dehydrogenase family)